jgi:SAM-dependent methyltransferase
VKRRPAGKQDTSAVHPGAASFERVAAEYDLGRPSWPAAAVETAGLPRSATVLDLGAGTGKLTRVLLDHFDRVIAVEPLAGMRALVPPAADVREGAAEAIPLPDESVDAVFCGESFHWFDWPRAIPEIARVLRPRGLLVLMWNRGPEDGSRPWPQGVTDVLDRVSHSPGEKRYRAFAWRDAFRGAPFEPLRHEVFPHEEDLPRDALLARIGSWSQFTTMEPEERAGHLREIGLHLTEPSYGVRLETQVWTTRLSASAAGSLPGRSPGSPSP